MPNPRPTPPDSLLDDIVLTHSLFLPTELFLQQLHQQYPRGAGGGIGGLREGGGVEVAQGECEGAMEDPRVGAGGGRQRGGGTGRGTRGGVTVTSA